MPSSLREAPYSTDKPPPLPMPRTPSASLLPHTVIPHSLQNGCGPVDPPLYGSVPLTGGKRLADDVSDTDNQEPASVVQYSQQLTLLQESSSSSQPQEQGREREREEQRRHDINRARGRRATGGIAASTSFFGLPFNLSMTSMRSVLGRTSSAARSGRIDWVSLCVIYMVTLTAEAARGLLMPSSWPYYASLGGGKATLGYFVAAFSLGRLTTTIPLGFMSDSLSIASILMFASALQVAGHFMYALSGSLRMLYAARILVGFGSSTMSVCRAHLTRGVPAASRTYHFAYLSGLQFIGFAVLPGAGGALALLPTYHPFPYVDLNGFTYPAYVLVLANLACIMLIRTLYVDPPPQSGTRLSSRQGSRTSSIQQDLFDTTLFETPQPDVLAMVICVLVNIVLRGLIAEFETISIPFMMEQYGVTYGMGSYLLSAVGFVGLIVYLCFKPISKRFSDRVLVMGGLLTAIVGCVPLALRSVSMHLPIAAYVMCLGLTWSVAFPIGQTAVLALFSKMLAGLPAGGLLGIFSASGSVARLVMAVAAAQLWDGFGREVVFAVIVAYVLVAMAVVGVAFPRLQPVGFL